MATDAPCPPCHSTGWSAKLIDGAWRVGMTGNLDTRHDAVITVHQHTDDDQEARRIAEWIASTYNAAIKREGQ